MRYKTSNQELLHKLDIIKHTKERTDIGRPVIFRDRTKYDRNKAKQELRNEIYNVG